MNPLSNAPAGPGAIPDNGTDVRPLLEGASEYEYVTIFNPLSVDFIGMVGVSRASSTPFEVRKSAGAVAQLTTNEQDVARNYGLSLKNPDHQGRNNIIQKVTLPSGKYTNLLGSEAQVIVRQLVNEIMQREKNSLKLADPHERNLVEQRVIIEKKSINDMLGRGPMTVQDQLRDAVDDSNKQLEEQTDEPEFPAVAQPRSAPVAVTGDTSPATPQTASPSGNSTEYVVPRQRRKRGPNKVKPAVK